MKLVEAADFIAGGMIVEGEWLLRSSLLFYRVLLLAYPREFREEYGPHMEQAFQDLCQHELEEGGVWSFFGFWLRTIFDVAATAFTEKCLLWRDPEAAVMFSFFWPGLGQLYNRQIAKGVPSVLLAVLWLLGWFGVWDVFSDAYYAIGLTLALVAVQVWSMIDAHKTAKRINAVSTQGHRTR